MNDVVVETKLLTLAMKIRPTLPAHLSHKSGHRRSFHRAAGAAGGMQLELGLRRATHGRMHTCRRMRSPACAHACLHVCMHAFVQGPMHWGLFPPTYPPHSTLHARGSQQKICAAPMQHYNRVHPTVTTAPPRVWCALSTCVHLTCCKWARPRTH